MPAVADIFEEGGSKLSKYIGMEQHHLDKAAEVLGKADKGPIFDEEVGIGGKTSFASYAFHSNLQQDAYEHGTSVLRQMGGSAMRGAVAGAAIGGTTSALNGGSFWDGAKHGAFVGAVGWGSYRTAMRGFGATSFNPLAGDGKGLFSSAAAHWNLLSGDGQVSKQAASILQQRKMDGLARGIMNLNKASQKKYGKDIF